MDEHRPCEAGATAPAAVGGIGDQADWGEAEEEESAGCFARLRRSKLLALVGEVLLGRDLFLASAGSPQQWLFARVSPHKFHQVLEISIYLYTHTHTHIHTTRS